MVSVNVFSLANILFTNCIIFKRRFDIKGLQQTCSYSFDQNPIISNLPYELILVQDYFMYLKSTSKWIKLDIDVVLTFSVLFSWSFIDGGKSAVLQYSEAFHSTFFFFLLPDTFNGLFISPKCNVLLNTIPQDFFSWVPGKKKTGFAFR